MSLHTLRTLIRFSCASDLGCAETVADGTTPNQYGTWIYGRAGWCPGSAVVLRTFGIDADDVTEGLTEVRALAPVFVSFY